MDSFCIIFFRTLSNLQNEAQQIAIRMVYLLLLNLQVQKLNKADSSIQKGYPSIGTRKT